MPAGDRTGPLGAGPRTGGRFGYCSGYPRPGYMGPGSGRGFGRGLGRGLGLGRGRGFGFGRGRGLGLGPGFRHAAAWDLPGYGYPPANEEAALADEAAFLEAELGRIRERLGELNKKGQEREDRTP